MVGVVVADDNVVRIITAGIQGPEGPAGPPGSDSGITISATAPLSPSLSDQWLDTSVTPNQIKLWNGAEWEEFVYKSELADGDGMLDINAGYF